MTQIIRWASQFGTLFDQCAPWKGAWVSPWDPLGPPRRQDPQKLSKKTLFRDPFRIPFRDHLETVGSLEALRTWNNRFVFPDPTLDWFLHRFWNLQKLWSVVNNNQIARSMISALVWIMTLIWSHFDTQNLHYTHLEVPFWYFLVTFWRIIFGHKKN